MDLKVAISGYKGFIGRYLARSFREMNYEVIGIERNVILSKPSELIRIVENCNILIHLSGAPILKRWNNSNKKEIWDSRVLSSKRIRDAVSAAEKKPDAVIFSSGKDIYKAGSIHDESSTDYRTGFIVDLIKEWEKPGHELCNIGIRTITMRLGLVLGKGGGIVSGLYTPFRFGLGSTICGGHQIMPFIHIFDLFSGINHLIKNTRYSGIVNFVSPELVNNKQFSQVFARITGRPCLFNIPCRAVRIVFGEAAILLTEGQCVVPGVLNATGFRFRYPDIENALAETMNKNVI